ncbi:MBL fold metallo-hydrolase [Chitinophagaceae bacterium IBVUCB2]|nr:MBL fold metallo-hydrolase [Chitinophagaceae bacterium IBVUCB2]
MSLYLTSLNSGSNANCYYIANRNEAVLVDTGLSCRETERRMVKLGLSMEKVRAIFISHEHGDHITGLAGLSKKYRLPVYITDSTLRNTRIPIDQQLIQSFNHTKPVRIGELSIQAFQKSHDAADPHSFMITGNGTNVGIITDIGYACKHVLKYFSRCHAVFLESNYCDNMLANGNYPYHLQQRISSDRGHLSNRQALELFQHYKSPELQLLILSHLSKNNNKPELVEQLFAPHAGKTKVVVASRYEAGPIFNIAGNEPMAVLQKKRALQKNENQLSLF